MSTNDVASVLIRNGIAKRNVWTGSWLVDGCVVDNAMSVALTRAWVAIVAYLP